MKKTSLILLTFLITFGIQAQTQIDNGGFEVWETIPGGSEPENWNSFLTGGGTLSNMAQNQIASSTDVRPGSSGTKSAYIWSNKIAGIIANGNMTIGKINMGAVQPSHADNYNRTIRSNPDFNQPLTDSPTGIKFWVKFTPKSDTDGSGNPYNARMKATIHDDYDYRDPEDATSQDHVVATAVLNYPSTNGEWVEMIVPFTYNGPATDPHYILVTFATNEIPGGGKENDKVWIDDVELLYVPLNIEKYDYLSNVSVYPNPAKDILVVDGIQTATEYVITSVIGEQVAAGNLSQITTHLNIAQINKGVYLLQLKEGQNTRTVRFIKE